MSNVPVFRRVSSEEQKNVIELGAQKRGVESSAVAQRAKILEFILYHGHGRG
jgi:hypothetical protein